MKHYTDDDLIDYLHAALPPGEDALVHAHLGHCTDCRHRYEAEAAFGDLLRGSSIAREREFPAMIKAKVWQAIRDREPTLLDRVRSFVRPAIAVPVAAMLVVAAYFGSTTIHSTVPTASGLSATYYLEEHAAEGQENPLADHSSVNANIAAERSASTTAPLIDAADASALDDTVATHI